MKKLFITVFIIGSFLLSSSLKANWIPGWHENALVGIAGGYDFLSAGVQANVIYQGPAIPANFPQTYLVRDYSERGGIYSFLIGYQATHDEYLLGVELEADWQNLNKSLPFAFADPSSLIGYTANTQYHRHLSAALSGRWGYAIVPDFLIYVRLGVEVSRDRLSTQFIGNPSVFPYSIVIQDKNWIYRCLSGIGLEMPIPCTAITTRLEYNFHSKGKTIETDGRINDGLINPLFQNRMQPKMQTAKIAFVWNFS